MNHHVSLPTITALLAQDIPDPRHWSVFSTENAGADLLERWFPRLLYACKEAPPSPWQGVVTDARMRSRFIVCPTSICSRAQMLANVRAWFTAGTIEELAITGRPVLLGAETGAQVRDFLLQLAEDWPLFFASNPGHMTVH